MMKILRDGQYLALKRGKYTVVLRHANGMIVSGCEPILKSIESNTAFTTAGMPDQLVQALKQVIHEATNSTEPMVLPSDGLCNGDGHSGSADIQPDGA